jgi:hypothetical protein
MGRVSTAPAPGDPVRVVTTKWVERPHWEFDAVHLGSDEHGDWLGLPVGTHLARPGAAFDTETDQVVLVPCGLWWIATFHAPGYRVATYVDMTTPPVWSSTHAGLRVGAVDLDLDVVELADGTVYVDDEDEFAEHRVEHRYPAEVVTGAEESCAQVADAVRRAVAPFDGSARAWLARVAPAG